MKKLLTLILFTAIAFTVKAQNEVKRVAILETVDKMGTVPYLKQLMFRSNLTTAITNTSGYEGYDRTDLKQIIGEQDFQRTGMVSDAQIKKIGEFTGAQYVLIAEATVDGNDMFITAKIIDVESARVIRNSNQLMGISAEEMQVGSQKVAADLLGVSLSSNDRATQQPKQPNSNASSGVSQSSEKAQANRSVDGYVDLGLPSGTLWKIDNEEGFYTYEQAVSKFGSNLPTKEQLEELKISCQWTRMKMKGYNVVGPNGNTIFMPTEGFQACNGFAVGAGFGCYWSSTSNGSDFAWILFIFGKQGCFINQDRQCSGFSVRLVQ